MCLNNRAITMTNESLLTLALTKSLALKELLENEFEALQAKDLAHFEALQSSKIDILSFLAAQNLNASLKALSDGESSIQNDLTSLDKVLDLLDECKKLHLRNEIFINRKLDSIRSALKIIQPPGASASVDVYDRLGKIRSRRPRNTMGDA